MRIIKKTYSSLIVAGLSAIPFIAFAETRPTGARSAEQIADFLRNDLANWLYIVGLAIAVIVVVIGGIQYMTAGGNEETQTKAKKTIISGLIGAGIVLLAGVIVATVAGFISKV